MAKSKTTHIHQIHFTVSKNGISNEINTKSYDFSNPQAKERAGQILNELKQRFTKVDGWSVQKHISHIEVTTHDVNN